MAAAKYLALILVLQVLGSSLGALVVDTTADLDTSGFASSDTYFPTAKELPDPVPQAIKDTENAGIWHFSEDANGFGGFLIIHEEMSFSAIEVTYYAPSNLKVYYQDVASGDEVAVPFQANKEEAWTTVKLEVPRDTVSDKSVAFRFVFESSADYFLLDKLDFKEGSTAPVRTTPTTEGTTPTAEVTTPIVGDPSSSTPADNASGAMTPTFITIVAFAILKAFL